MQFSVNDIPDYFGTLSLANQRAYCEQYIIHKNIIKNENYI